MPPFTRSLPAEDHRESADEPVPSGWQAPLVPPDSRPAAYRRSDGAEVFFDRRSRADNPLDALRPGWNWLARRSDGTMLGHRVAGPAADGGSRPVPEDGLFLPRKFKTAVEAMRALDRDTPARPVTPPVISNHSFGGTLAQLEARGGDLLGPDGTLLARVGLSWDKVALDGPLTLAALPPVAMGDEQPQRPRGALADAQEAVARGLPIVAVGEEDARALRRLVEKLVAVPSASAAGQAREFLDFLVANTAPVPVKPPRKRIVLDGRPPATSPDHAVTG